MKVICAGLSKTGTTSLRAALLHLGYSNHDVNEHWCYNMQNYIDALEGRVPDFRRMYEDVDSITDTPACVFYEEIFKAFPDAKVVLSVRDTEEDWKKSLIDTRDKVFAFARSWWFILLVILTPSGRRWGKLMRALKARKWDYNEHNAKVQSVIPSDRLLVFNCKEGWEPLCKFLGKDIPSIPFPRLNIKGDMVTDVNFYKMDVFKQMRKELVLLVTVLGLLAAVLFAVVFQPS